MQQINFLLQLFIFRGRIEKLCTYYYEKEVVDLNSSSERMILIQQRVAQYQHAKNQHRAALLQWISGGLFCLLIFCIHVFSIPYRSGAVSGAYGAILLIDGMGGYVLTAVVTFLIATVITVVCMKKHDLNQEAKK